MCRLRHELGHRCCCTRWPEKPKVTFELRPKGQERSGKSPQGTTRSVSAEVLRPHAAYQQLHRGQQAALRSLGTQVTLEGTQNRVGSIQKGSRLKILPLENSG